MLIAITTVAVLAMSTGDVGTMVTILSLGDSLDPSSLQVPIETLIRTGKLDQCHQVGHGDPLGVEGSSAPDIAIGDATREGRHAPLGRIRWHGIEMR